MLNVMIVDDEPFMLKGLRTIIEKGSTPCSAIVSAGDGIEALEKLEAFRPDLLITDIQMPEMNGLELIREARRRGLCGRFVILTGYDDTAYLRQAIRSKVIDYLLKPIDKTELYDVLANLSVELLRGEERREEAGRAPEEAEPFDRNAVSKSVKRIIRFVEEHYAGDLSLDQVADHISLHPNYISSLFRKETGLTFVQYLHLYRIRKAKDVMLRQTDLSFHEISERVGYENVRHFFSVFKKYAGVTPGEYRELYKRR